MVGVRLRVCRPVALAAVGGTPPGHWEVLGLAYATTKLTEPLRLLATLGITPWVARKLGR